ncbi:unnamed protein product [Protopolystoma xenopodis]|uniref:Uncharacterized protein n=1 Tax=Protopolystoma xenopodis TaxID=117903 RepID=A0A3S5AEP1_9PLAT|nr:unnamed protein product [Protopolystoma xenopodis]
MILAHEKARRNEKPFWTAQQPLRLLLTPAVCRPLFVFCPNDGCVFTVWLIATRPLGPNILSESQYGRSPPSGQGTDGQVGWEVGSTGGIGSEPSEANKRTDAIFSFCRFLPTRDRFVATRLSALARLVSSLSPSSCMLLAFRC